MRRFAFVVLALSLMAFTAFPAPAAAEVEKAVIDILGGMQCSL
jgi:hypothetical protein